MDDRRPKAGEWVNDLVNRLERASADLGPGAGGLLRHWRACQADLQRNGADALADESPARPGEDRVRSRRRQVRRQLQEINRALEARSRHESAEK